MKKIKINLNRAEMDFLINYLQFVLENEKDYGYTKDIADRHLMASLCELYNKLCRVESPFKHAYKLKIEMSQGLGLLNHCMAMPFFPAADEIIVNRIIGLIDQQTL